MYCQHFVVSCTPIGLNNAQSAHLKNKANQLLPWLIATLVTQSLDAFADEVAAVTLSVQTVFASPGLSVVASASRPLVLFARHLLALVDTTPPMQQTRQ